MKDSILAKPQIRCALALLCCILWGSAFPCIKIGYEWFSIDDTGSQILFAGYRFLLAGMITFGLGSVIEKGRLSAKKTYIPQLLGIGLLQTTVQYVFFYMGLGLVSGAKASIINGTSTFAAIILAHFLIKNDRMTWQKAVGCLIGFSGVMLVNLEGLGGGFFGIGEGMLLISSFAYGASSTLVKIFSDRITPMAITAYPMLFGSTVMILIGIAMGGSVTDFTVKSSFLLLYMALISSAGFGIWNALLKYNPVGKVAIFGFSIPVFGTLLSGLLLRERIFSPEILLSLLLVCVGITIVNRPQKRHEERT